MATPATLVNKSMLTLTEYRLLVLYIGKGGGGGGVFVVWDNITQISDQNSESLGHIL